MSAVETGTRAFALALDEEDRTLLLAVLEQALHDTQIEVHRTDSPGFRQHVQRKEDLLQRVIDVLRKP